MKWDYEMHWWRIQNLRLFDFRYLLTTNRIIQETSFFSLISQDIRKKCCDAMNCHKDLAGPFWLIFAYLKNQWAPTDSAHDRPRRRGRPKHPKGPGLEERRPKFHLLISSFFLSCHFLGSSSFLRFCFSQAGAAGTSDLPRQPDIFINSHFVKTILLAKHRLKEHL